MINIQRNCWKNYKIIKCKSIAQWLNSLILGTSLLKELQSDPYPQI